MKNFEETIHISSSDNFEGVINTLSMLEYILKQDSKSIRDTELADKIRKIRVECNSAAFKQNITYKEKYGL